MKLAACSACLPHADLDALLRYLAAHDIGAIELGVGGWPGTRHADAHRLVGDGAAQAALRDQLSASGVTLAALACHGNPLHPDARVAGSFHNDFIAALELAHQLSVPVLVCFSGQPGSGGRPNWPVMGWPDDYAALAEEQWEQVIVPYWRPLAARARSLGVRLAFEMHGGFAVHSPATLMRLHEACGPAIAANLDPSHLWWQGIDPARAALRLGQAVAHVHLKDVCMRAEQLEWKGLLDATPHSRMDERAWYFDAPGRGHDAATWRGLLDALETIGYGGVLAIEHEGPTPSEIATAATARWMRQLRPLD